MCKTNCCLKANIECGTNEIVIYTPAALSLEIDVVITDVLGNVIKTKAICTELDKLVIDCTTLPEGFMTKDKNFKIEFFYSNTAMPYNALIQSYHNCIDVELGNLTNSIGESYHV